MIRNLIAVAFIGAAAGAGPVRAQAPATSTTVEAALPEAASGEAGGEDPPASIPAAAVAADGAPADSAAADSGAPVVDRGALERQRTPVEAMTEHFLGSTSRAVRFDWRRTSATFGVLGGELIERNNFGARRLGAFVRHAFSDVIVEGAVNRVFVEPTTSSELLALTPYRQFGRPDHFELDLNVGIAVVEGVVTPRFPYVPPMEMALVAVAGGRYLLYPETFGGGRAPTDIALNLAAPALSEDELLILDDSALPGMLPDPARYHLLAGLALDVYVQPGFYVSPRAMVAIPVVAVATGSGLGWFWELSLAIGYAL